MVQLSAPGVYLSEVQSAPSAVSLGSTSAGGIIGFTKEGPLNEAKLVTSYADFVRQYGSPSIDSLVGLGALSFFTNGGRRLWVVRVANGALKASQYVSGQVLDEALSDGVADQTLIGTLEKTPVIYSELSITDTVEVFTSDENGVLTGDAGGSGVIDLDSGEFELTFNAAPTDPATATYTYKRFEVFAKSEGGWGNEIRFGLSGSTNYYTEATGTYTRYDVTIERLIDGSYQTVEQFVGLVMDDDDDENYFATRLNNVDRGSRYVTIEAYNEESVEALNGTLVANETIESTPAFNGTVKTFTFALDNGDVQPTSLSLSLKLAINDEVFAVADGLTNVFSATLDVRPIDPGSVKIVTAFETFTDNGEGVLTSNLGGSGTVDYDTGVVAVGFLFTPGAGNIPAHYRQVEIVATDDGDGGIVQQEQAGTGLNSLVVADCEVDYDTGEVTLKFASAPVLGHVDKTLPVLRATYYERPSQTVNRSVLVNGSDGLSITRSQVSAPALSGNSEGIYAFGAVPEDLMLMCPDFESNATVISDLVDYADSVTDRFVFASVPEGKTPADAVTWKQRVLNKKSSRLALVYPHVRIVNPANNVEINFPAGCIVAGIHARTDALKGPAKAAAGVQDGVIAGALGLERVLTQTELGVLTDANINGLLDWPSTGRVLWGARTTSDNLSYRYITTRRVLMAIGKAVYNASQAFVFEKNNATLWIQMRLLISGFLSGLFKAGWFSGSSEADAYYVICDDTINTPTDIDNGIVKCQIGVAPVKPAEFIVLELALKRTT